MKPLPLHTNTTFEDLSGISTSSFTNPYDALIAACEDEPVRHHAGFSLKMIDVYNRHRYKRNIACTAPREMPSKKPNCLMRALLESASTPFWRG
jgi:hypothetical protein